MPHMSALNKLPAGSFPGKAGPERGPECRTPRFPHLPDAAPCHGWIVAAHRNVGGWLDSPTSGGHRYCRRPSTARPRRTTPFAANRGLGRHFPVNPEFPLPPQNRSDPPIRPDPGGARGEQSTKVRLGPPASNPSPLGIGTAPEFARTPIAAVPNTPLPLPYWMIPVRKSHFTDLVVCEDPI